MSDNDLVKRGVIKERMIARGWKHPDSTVTEFVEDDLPAVPTDGDLVSRNWLLAEYDRQHEGSAGKARKLIEDAPAVPREMTAREFMRAKNRMCGVYKRNDRETGCWECPLYDFCDEYNDDEDIAQQNADEAVAIVEEWAQEHPERSEE